MSKESKIGNKNDPLFIMLIVFLSGGLVGVIWLVLMMENLRRYRHKGISGWFVLGLLLLNFLNTGFWSTSAGNEMLVIPFLSLLFLFFIFFRMAFVIERETARLGVVDSKWFEIGALQVLAIILTYLSIYVNILSKSPLSPNYFKYAIFLIIPAFILHCLWFFFIQKKLNQLWQLAEATKPFAVPDMIAATSETSEYNEVVSNE